MRKIYLSINLVIFVIAVLIISFFLLQLNGNSILKQELDKKRQAFKEAESTYQHLESLKELSQDLIAKEALIKRKVPFNERYPFSLIRAFTSIAGEIGLRRVVFTIKETEKKGDYISQQGQIFAQQEGSSGGMPGESAEHLASSVNKSPDDLQIRPKPLKIEINFEGTYVQVLSLLERLMNLERVIIVEEIKIESKKEILPYQKVSLHLATFTFLKQ